MSNVAVVGTETFTDEVEQATQPVVVDFWAEWCSPCRALSPVVEKIAAKFNGRLKVVKCNIDDNPELMTKFGVMTIPNLLFFKNGQVVDQAVGYMNETQLSDKVSAVLDS